MVGWGLGCLQLSEDSAALGPDPDPARCKDLEEGLGGGACAEGEKPMAMPPRPPPRGVEDLVELGNCPGG